MILKVREYMKKRRKKCFYFILFVLLFLILVVFIFLKTDKNLRILILESAESKVGLIMSDCANTSVNKAINENDITYSDIIRVNRDENNNITSLQTDIINLNKIRTEIDRLFSKEMEKNSIINLNLPIGSVIGNEYTIGRGPCINYELEVSVNTSTDYQSKFYSAGINQTLHQITVLVSGDAYIMSPWYRNTIKFSTEYIVAETVITGVVPETIADFDVKKTGDFNE